MNCPNCNTKLLISERKGIEIDYCPDCRGVWLDRGELDKIIERSLTNQEPSLNRDSFTQSDFEKKIYHQKYHKKSWLNELFD